MRKNSIKNTRINGEVMKELSLIIRQEIKDPRIHMMTSVTSVEVAPDLKTCKAYISVMGSDEEKKDTIAGLRSAEGYVRRQLAKRLNLRNTPEIQFVLDRSKQLNQIQDAMESKQIPRRVTHNDTRYSNVLIDSDSKKSICLIDLDTVMSGASILDFGDAVRAGAATFTEDEKFGNIELDLDLYRGYVQGYCHEMGRILTAKEKELMVYAVWLMTMESGIRFLTDYLSGDRNITNFSDERQNLYRAVNQFFLVLDIEEKKEQMQEITAAVLMKK